MDRTFIIPLAAAAVAWCAVAPLGAQEPQPMAHDMWSAPLGGGWTLRGMAQVVPLVTAGAPGVDGSPLRRTAAYLTQPVVMANVESPGARWVLRFTPNVEGMTQPDGELTPGGWGEGFLDSRHPHTLLHEAMLSLNVWDAAGGALSLSVGRGFAPYGTDDPMARPIVKYPTNHHLSQLLERWTVNAVYLVEGWGIELGWFGGEEPTGPYDMGNIEGFGNSWSARASRRFGAGSGPAAAWEVSASVARVQEEDVRTTLWNAAVRHEARQAFGELYLLGEASIGRPRGPGAGDSEGGYFSVLGEGELRTGRHRPYVRLELATRPEYERAAAGGDPFFRYEHHDPPIGATRWLIGSVGYAHRATDLPLSARPFVEAHWHRAWRERGPEALEPQTLFGTERFWSLSAGVRIFLGGGRMRMGAYGVLDPMTAAMRAADDAEPGHEDHGQHR